MGKVVFDSWERNGIKPKFNLDLFFFWFLIDKLKFYKKVVQNRGDIGFDKVVMKG